MPIYDYQCASCGEFSQMRPMAESALDHACPQCGEDAPRIISAPRLSIMDPSNRMRWERNEKSRHSPAVARRSSCGCTGAHTCGSSKTSSPGKDKTRPVDPEAKPALRAQTKKTARPWMLGH